MWLMKKSQKVVTVNCEMKENRVSLPKTQEQLSKMDDDETNVFATSVIDRYAARPNDIKEMCLASFAVNYDVLLAVDDCDFNDETQKLSNDSTQNSTPISSNKIQLHRRLGTMRKCKKEAILRTQQYNVSSHLENITIQNFYYIIHGWMRMN